MMTSARKIFSSEFLLSLSLVLVSQTRFRLADGVGPGEIGLAILILTTFLGIFSPRFELFVPKRYGFAWLLVLFGLFVLTPITLLNAETGMRGPVPRDILAYLLSFLLVFTAIVRRLDLASVASFTVILMCLVFTGQYLLGGDQAWYLSARFSAGSDNPNQLALYLVCGFLMIAMTDWRLPVKSLFAGALIAFGILSQSDAFMLATLAMAGSWTAFRLVPRAWFPAFLLFGALPIAIGILFLATQTDLLADIQSIWAHSNGGSERSILYINGIKAYLSTPVAWPFGFGAGGYSGNTGPFGGQEAHNTIIDCLTIGGVALVALVHWPLLRTLWEAYSLKRYAIAATIVGLLVFTMFHFVGRQPVFWFTVIAAIQSLYGLEVRERTLRRHTKDPITDAPSMPGGGLHA